jgi:2-methylcitrate dehydratase PrpD
MVQDEGGTAQASVFGLQARIPARGAALANGTTSHALDYDDTHFAHIGHPSVAVFSAALAVAEASGASLPAVLEAALVGMESSIRVGVWLGRSHYQTGFHQTATAGAFGAAVAAARLYQLDVDQMTHVIGLTATRAAGLKAQFGTMGKPYNAGIAAATGVEVAQLVAQGFVANPGALDGPYGFGTTHHGESNAGALDGLGTTWMFEGVSHKFHACCHGLHAALEAQRNLGMAAQEVAQITVHTHPRWMSVCNQPAPTTGLGAKFSYRTVLAMQLLGHDTAVLDSYSSAICADPRVQDLRDRVEVQVDETLAETAARVDILRRDGTSHSAHHDLDDPIALDARGDRVRAKATALLGADATTEAWAALQSKGSVSGLAALVRG